MIIHGAPVHPLLKYILHHNRSVVEWCADSGVPRSALYAWISKGQLTTAARARLRDLGVPVEVLDLFSKRISRKSAKRRAREEIIELANEVKRKQCRSYVQAALRLAEYLLEHECGSTSAPTSPTSSPDT